MNKGQRRAELLRLRDQRISKLPQWAQVYIANLERRVLDAEDQIALIAGDEEENANVFISGRAKQDDPAIGRDVKIRFQMDPAGGRQSMRFVDIRHGHASEDAEGSLVIHSDRRILVEPYATNSIRIVVVR